MFETSSETNSNSPLQALLEGAWWILKFEKFLQDFDKQTPSKENKNEDSKMV